jgi:hypothetical protein
MDLGFWNSATFTNPIYHGTFIAGIIGAVGNNGTGVAGLNWSVQIMAIRFFGGDHFDPQVHIVTRLWSDALMAWDYVLMMKRRGINIRITNNSYGNYQESVALRDAMAAAGEEGILNVCTAGNQNVNTDVFSTFPGSFNLASVINVANSTELDTLKVNSNFGASTVDLAAPGDNITSTWKGSEYRSGGSGTSFAGPMVAGAAALLLAVEPSLTVSQLKAAIFGSVDQPASLRGKVVTNGRLNIAGALQYLTNANPPGIVITALPAGQRTPTNAPIQVTFNRPMNRATVESAFSIQPPIGGTFEWSTDSRSFLYRHDTPFDSTTNYTARILGTAQDESGATLDGDFDRDREGSPTDDFVWTFRFPIPNDDFTSAKLITGVSGVIQSSNRYATVELNEPDHTDNRTSTSSVWYQWMPPDSGGWFTFDLTSGTAFDSLLAIYAGQSFEHFVNVGGNDNYGSASSSRVSFEARASTNYAITVAGKSSDGTRRSVGPNQSGVFQLRWYPTPAPAVSSFSPSSAYPGQTVIINGTNFTGATSVLFNGTSASFSNALTNNLDLRITAIVPPDATTGPITIETPHGNFTTVSDITVLVLPQLAIQSLPENRVELAWPVTSGFNLQHRDTLGPTGNWTAATTLTAITNNGQRIVTVPNAAPIRFFRLYRP